jgi:hypothetical protein
MAGTHHVSTPAARRQGRADLTRALGVAAVIGAGLAYGAAHHRRTTRRRATSADGRRSTLATYIREHLSGSDVAILVLERVRRSHAGTKEGSLFSSMYDSIQRERDLLRALLADLGESPLSTKRVATQVTGSLLGVVAGGQRDDLSLFRTLEGLAIGVQGKRLMWRAFQSLAGFPAASPQRFAELEALAVRQWEAIEERRLSLVPELFGGDDVTWLMRGDQIQDDQSGGQPGGEQFESA